MKNTLSFGVLFLSVTSILFSCNTKTNTENSGGQPIEKSQIYSLSPDSASLKWTAFKTTQRIGVSGTFDSISIECVKTTGTIEELLENAKIRVNTASINSNNEIRDPKIVEFFFGNFSVPNEIVGSIDSIANDNVYIGLTMNGIKQTAVADYSIADNLLNISAIIHLPDWNAESGLSELNKECDDLHKGEDGVSKLWPEIAVDITCPVEHFE